MDLVEFLTARLDEKERDAREMAKHYPPPWEVLDRGWMARVVAAEPNFWEVVRLEEWPGMPTGSDASWLGDVIRHVANWDPARVLADVAAKRQVITSCVEVIGGRDLSRYGEFGALRGDPEAMAVTLAVETLRTLALPDADHPDYREEWKP